MNLSPLAIPIALALALLLVSPLHAESSSPAQPVERLEQALLTNMQADTDFEVRYQRLRPLMDDIMAVDRMGRYLFGRDWREFDEHERDRFCQHFLDLSAATYANQFDSFDGERFEPVDIQQQSGDRAIVKRRLITGGGREVAFDYLMTLEGDAWHIVTIIAEGVSDLAVKRSQYRQILSEQGLSGVIDYIEQQVSKQRGD